MEMTNAEVCARAHKYERENVLMHRIMLVLAPILAAWILYRLYVVLFGQNYILVATLGWLLLTFGYVSWRFVQNGPRRMNPGEPCFNFLSREFEGKRRAAQATRLWMLLLIPAVLADWWGGGPALTAKLLGIKAAWLRQVHAPVPLIINISVFALIWYAIGDMARKASREIEKMGQK